MPDPSLNRRLDQHARRSGFAIGASMAVTIALLIGGFVWLFATINPYLSDFIGAEANPTETPTTVAVADGTTPADGPSTTPTREPTTAPTEEPTQAPTQAPTAAPTEEPTQAPTQAPTAAPTEEPEDGFQPDYQVAVDGTSINFRDAPGTEGTNTIEALDPGTELQSTGEEETINGVVWMEFVDEQDRTGWMREIDVEQVDE